MKASVLALGILVLSAVFAVVIVACDSTSSDCPPGKLRLQIQLTGTASLADTITVQAYDPALLQSFPNTPANFSAGLFNLDVSFPAGYPANKLLNLLVRAYGKGQLIGETIEQIHLLPGCTLGVATLRAQTIDASPPTD